MASTSWEISTISGLLKPEGSSHWAATSQGTDKNPKGANPEFVVTSLSPERLGTSAITSTIEQSTVRGATWRTDRTIKVYSSVLDLFARNRTSAATYARQQSVNSGCICPPPPTCSCTQSEGVGLGRWKQITPMAGVLLFALSVERGTIRLKLAEDRRFRSASSARARLDRTHSCGEAYPYSEVFVCRTRF